VFPGGGGQGSDSCNIYPAKVRKEPARKTTKKMLYKKGKSGEKQQGHFLCVFMGQANKKGFLVCVCVRKSAGKVKEGGGKSGESGAKGGRKQP